MRTQCVTCRALMPIDLNNLGGVTVCSSCNNQLQIPDSITAPGMVIDDFIIQECIGKGGMGIVYRAYQITLDRMVALKILLDKFQQNQEFVAELVTEARVAAKLNHPNITKAYAVGQDEGFYFIAMELVDGVSVHHLLKESDELDVEWCMVVARKVCLGLKHAWDNHRMVHRDIKPENILIRADNGDVKLTDMGLARPDHELFDHMEHDIQATPQYLCPENLTGELLDCRSDIYSLGATLYHMLTHRFPFVGADGMAIAEQHLEAELIPPQQIRDDLPDDVNQLVCKMMEKKPSRRFQDYDSLIKRVTQILKDLKSGTSRRRRNITIDQTVKQRVTAYSQAKEQVEHGEVTTNNLGRSNRDQGESEREEKKKSKAPIILAVAGAVLLVLIVVIALMMNNKPQPETDPKKKVEKKSKAPPISRKVDPLPVTNPFRDYLVLGPIKQKVKEQTIQGAVFPKSPGAWPNFGASVSVVGQGRIFWTRPFQNVSAAEFNLRGFYGEKIQYHYAFLCAAIYSDAENKIRISVEQQGELKGWLNNHQIYDMARNENGPQSLEITLKKGRNVLLFKTRITGVQGWNVKAQLFPPEVKKSMKVSFGNPKDEDKLLEKIK